MNYSLAKGYRLWISSLLINHPINRMAARETYSPYKNPLAFPKRLSTFYIVLDKLLLAIELP